jgi:KUP system potassium uptake protein
MSRISAPGPLAAQGAALPPVAAPDRARARLPAASVLLAVLGVVYGDIGTSPLYALKASLDHFAGSPPLVLDILGVLSLIFWSLVLIVTVKYVLLVMRADNHGEGGILALMALAQRVAANATTRRVLQLVGIGGACLFFGDGVITPAISVLSALEGVEVSAPELQQFVLPLAAAIIVVLFAVQWRGTGSVGRMFGPVMAVWFSVIGLLGGIAVVQHPFVLQALSPHFAVLFAIHHGFLAFVSLGSVVLAVTGAEALYADMGHFGARPIRLSWLFFVLPCLVLNYFGQGALIVGDRTALANPFFLLAPTWLRLPMVILATAATVIASQALISGAYSIARQCMQMGFLPRMTVRHTSQTEEGQIYVPQINAALAVGVLLLVFAFRTSGSLAAAYGIAVTGTFICTCILATVVFRRQFKWSRPAAISVFGSFFVIDCVFFAANSLKVPDGGWVPLVLGLLLMGLMTSWRRGRDLTLDRWKQDSLPLASFLSRLPQSRTVRVPGIAVFLTGNPDFVPGALLHNLKHNKVLHERVLFVTVLNIDQPEVGADNRTEVQELAPGLYRVILRYGFMESPNIPRALEDLRSRGVPYDPMQVSYFLSRETLVPAMAPKMPIWRLWLFLVMARNAVSATEFFRIPSDRVVELGVRVAI